MTPLDQSPQCSSESLNDCNSEEISFQFQVQRKLWIDEKTRDVTSGEDLVTPITENVDIVLEDEDWGQLDEVEYSVTDVEFSPVEQHSASSFCISSHIVECCCFIFVVFIYQLCHQIE